MKDIEEFCDSMGFQKVAAPCEGKDCKCLHNFMSEPFILNRENGELGATTLVYPQQKKEIPNCPKTVASLHSLLENRS